jgi:hypothetical protein
MDAFKVWCSLEPDGLGASADRPTWHDSAIAPAPAAVEAAKAFTRGDPGLTPVYCLVLREGADELPSRHEVTTEPCVSWKCRRFE